MPLIYFIKKLYDWSVLDELRAGKTYISEAKIEVYERHKADLVVFKRLLRHNQEIYKEMLDRARQKLDNYAAYSGRRAANYRCSYEAFGKYARKQLDAVIPIANTKISRILLLFDPLDNKVYYFVERLDKTDMAWYTPYRGGA